MSYFADLRSKEHPLALRLLIALIIFSFALVLGLGLVAAISRSTGNLFFRFSVFLAVLVGLGLLLKRNGFHLATLLGIPVASGFSLVNHMLYAGVISPWSLYIIALAWALAFILGRKRPRALQIGLCALMAMVIALTTYLSLPEYTHAQAQALLAEELQLSHAQFGPGFGHMPRILCLGSARPAIFVNSGYLFDAQAEGMVTTYFFDPVSGEWFEFYPPWSLDSLTHKELDPTTQRWLEDLEEKGYQIE